ncbi:UNVERIFIED_CONTAM: hypothetical protein PYX00_004261 [Menopon gallinae]
MSRLGLTMPTPQRHRIKRDIRQPMQRLFRSSIDRRDLNNSSSTQTSLITSSNMARLTKIPQLQTSFFCSRAPASNDCDESNSDSSDSEDGSELPQQRNNLTAQDESTVLHQTILHNYNFTFPTPTAKFFLPMSWDRKDKDNHTLPSTSRNAMDDNGQESSSDFQTVKVPKVSECIQYTFPKVHEGSHQADVHSVVTAIGQNVRNKRSQSEIASDKKDEELAATSNGYDRSEEEVQNNIGFESESQSSTDDEVRRRKKSERGAPSVRNRRFDIEQDGFQADESSNCLTSTENSLERVAIREADLEKN